MRPFVRLFATGVIFAALTVSAQQPEIVHGQLSSQTATQGVATALSSLKKQQAPAWLGYSVPAIDTFSSGGEDNRVSYLEPAKDASGHNIGNYKKQSYDHVVILLRVVDGAIDKLRIDNPDRQIDAGGDAFTWLNAVDPEDSIRFLTNLAQKSQDRKLRDSYILAISLHQSSAATKALADLTAPANGKDLREKAAFWLASQRGHDGLVVIERLTHEDTDPTFREKLTFDLTLSREPAALDDLVRMAHNDASPEVRKKAQFWMANKGGKKIAGDLRQSAESDPEVSIRKSAVFALSRLPAPEAATELIAIANSSKDPAVRRQAIFWLGESKDPKALDYLSKLLTAPAR
jgi:HEAT repeat protein